MTRGAERPSVSLARPAGLRRLVAALWDGIFGAPAARDRPDGGVEARLLGRRFNASSRAALFDAVGRERERLLTQLDQLHRNSINSVSGFSRVVDSSHGDARRLQDRLAVYSAFLGRLARELEAEAAESGR